MAAGSICAPGRLAQSAPALSGTDRYSWTTGDLVYELVAHGMPKSRFAIIAGAAEQQTRAGSDHDRIDRRLREAAINAAALRRLTATSNA